MICERRMGVGDKGCDRKERYNIIKKNEWLSSGNYRQQCFINSWLSIMEGGKEREKGWGGV